MPSVTFSGNRPWGFEWDRSVTFSRDPHQWDSVSQDIAGMLSGDTARMLAESESPTANPLMEQRADAISRLVRRGKGLDKTDSHLRDIGTYSSTRILKTTLLVKVTIGAPLKTRPDRRKR